MDNNIAIKKSPSTSNFSEKTKVDDNISDEATLGFEEKFINNETKNVELESGFSTVALSNDNKDEVVYVDRKEEKKLIKKLDLHILPLFCLFYFADFLDRANIGNATLAGIQGDLGMTSTELSTSISAFFITYIIFEVPSNIVLKKTNAAKWLSFIMFVWGVATLLTAFVQNFAGLVVARLVLGAAESGYIPGILFILSKVYTPNEFSIRVGILLTMATLSGLVSGPLAYAVSFLDGRHGLNTWQYLFIVEGVPTIVLSIVSYFYLFDDVQKVKWLSTEQKILQHNRMSHQNAETNDDPVTIKSFKIAIYDWKTWAFSLVFLLNSINVTSITVFSPTLIGGFGFSPLTSQLLTAPPCAIATIGVLLGGYLAARYNCRSPILVVGSLIIAIGYMLLIVLYDKWALYGVLFIIPAGMGMQATAAIGWSAINYPDLAVRAVAVAVVLMIGNIGSIIAAYLFRSTDAPRYVFGIVFNLITALVSACVSALTGYMLHRENIRRDRNPNETNQFRFFY